MLLKAEARTVTALTNFKSPAQTRQIMIAAYKRAGLADPFRLRPREDLLAHPPLADIARDLDDLRQALLNQVEITQAIAETMQKIPRAQNFDNLAEAFAMAQRSNVGAISALANLVSKAETALTHGRDTAYLTLLTDFLSTCRLQRRIQTVTLVYTPPEEPQS